MRRVVVNLLVVSVLLLSGGAMSWMHDRVHELHDSIHAAAPAAAPAPLGETPVDETPFGEMPAGHHDESNCFLHAQLAAFVTAMPGFTPLLASPGLLVAFVTTPPRVLHMTRRIVSLDCRGPPVL